MRKSHRHKCLLGNNNFHVVIGQTQTKIINAHILVVIVHCKGRPSYRDIFSVMSFLSSLEKIDLDERINTYILNTF